MNEQEKAEFEFINKQLTNTQGALARATRRLEHLYFLERELLKGDGFRCDNCEEVYPGDFMGDLSQGAGASEKTLCIDCECDDGDI